LRIFRRDAPDDVRDGQRPAQPSQVISLLGYLLVASPKNGARD
jgi:hypothetical protein